MWVGWGVGGFCVDNHLLEQDLYSMSPEGCYTSKKKDARRPQLWKVAFFLLLLLHRTLCRTKIMGKNNGINFKGVFGFLPLLFCLPPHIAGGGKKWYLHKTNVNKKWNFSTMHNKKPRLSTGEDSINPNRVRYCKVNLSLAQGHLCNKKQHQYQ